jgi:transcriptional regulator with XRE-family HTH domain
LWAPDLDERDAVRTTEETASWTCVAGTAIPGTARPSLPLIASRTVEGMADQTGFGGVGRAENRAEVRDFLTSRRARITPERAGLPLYGTNRRVPGLRREELAMLVGISNDYLVRLERGNLTGVSESVLEALAAALQLDESERTHLFDLARAANRSTRQRRTAPKQHVRQGVQRILDTIGAPAYVRNNRLDLLAVNRPGRGLLADLYPAEGEAGGAARAATAPPPNLARYMFLDDRSRDFYVEWASVAKDTVAALRIEAGRTPYDRGLTVLVGELSTRSEEFRVWWASHNVRLHRTSTKQMHHPVVGDLELTGEALALPGDTGLTIITYTVEPQSASAEALNFLASWAAQTVTQAGDPTTAESGPASHH